MAKSKIERDPEKVYAYQGRLYGKGQELTLEDLDADFDEEHAPRQSATAKRRSERQKAAPRRPGQGNPSGIDDAEEVNEDGTVGDDADDEDLDEEEDEEDEDLEDLTVEELQDMLREQDKPVSGNKAQLIKRLQE